MGQSSQGSSWCCEIWPVCLQAAVILLRKTIGKLRLTLEGKCFSMISTTKRNLSKYKWIYSIPVSTRVPLSPLPSICLMMARTLILQGGNGWDMLWACHNIFPTKTNCFFSHVWSGELKRDHENNENDKENSNTNINCFLSCHDIKRCTCFRQ